jgi:hypothetical protein
MAMISTSVQALTEPLPDAEALNARLAELRARFPRAIVDRYLRAMPTFGTRVVLSTRRRRRGGRSSGGRRLDLVRTPCCGAISRP